MYLWISGGTPNKTCPAISCYEKVCSVKKADGDTHPTNSLVTKAKHNSDSWYHLTRVVNDKILNGCITRSIKFPNQSSVKHSSVNMSVVFCTLSQHGSHFQLQVNIAVSKSTDNQHGTQGKYSHWHGWHEFEWNDVHLFLSNFWEPMIKNTF